VQELADEKIVAPTGFRVTTEPTYGNRILFCRVSNPEPVTELRWSYTVTRWEDRGQGRLPANPRYLMPNVRIPIAGKARQMATKLGVTDDSTPLEARAKTIYDDVLGNMVYDKKHSGWGLGDFEHATTVCMGNCTDFHSRFIGIGRAAGIPVRFTMGIPMKPKAKGEYNSYHCWAHYLDNGRWRPVDISEADKIADRDPAKARWFFGNLDANRITLTFGRDLVLEPPQKGPPLNYFVFPYAEADGKPLPMSKKENWKFFYEDV
jgi:transglutaminase-like putative cysteine protease